MSKKRKNKKTTRPSKRSVKPPKARTGKKPAGKKPAGRPTAYDPKFSGIVAACASNPVTLMEKGQISNRRLGEMLGGFSAEAVRTWRTKVPGHEGSFQPEFAAAVRACQSAFDTDRIKRAMVERAAGFVQTKTKYETAIKGPPLPAASWTKKRLLDYADEYKAPVDVTLKKTDLFLVLKKWAAAQQKDVMRMVSREKITHTGDVAAAKLVLPNLERNKDPDDADETWDVSDKVQNTHEMGKTLAEFLRDYDGDARKNENR